MFGAVSIARVRNHSNPVFLVILTSRQKYLLPHLRPPTATAYEEDRDALTAQFDAAEALLKEIQADTAAVRQAVEDQSAKVDKVTQDVEDAVKEMRDGETRNRDEMREIRDEITTIQESLPKVRVQTSFSSPFDLRLS